MVPVAEQRAENVSGVLEPIIDGDHRAAMTAGRIFQHFQLGRLGAGAIPAELFRQLVPRDIGRNGRHHRGALHGSHERNAGLPGRTHDVLFQG